VCGVAGCITHDESGSSSRMVGDIISDLNHRGPDEGQLQELGPAVFGIARLRIIGTTTGDQPVISSTRRTMVVFNGEIYNHSLLRLELQKDGICLDGESDAVIIPYLYEKYGTAFVDKVQGMFAIAIYDHVQRKSFFISDRSGKKPLYYCIHEGAVFFSSEVYPLARRGIAAAEIDFDALNLYLSYRIIPAPMTAYKRVKKLARGSIVTVDEGLVVTVSSYLVRGATAEPFSSLAEAAEALEQCLLNAIDTRIPENVPFGATLSGGLDSSLVVAMLSRRFCGNIKTFSVGFDNPDFDEVRYAEIVAKHIGTEHSVFRITECDAKEAISDIIKSTGEPYAFPSAIASYYMYKIAGDDVRVALTGDGSDELFCGYSRYANILAHCPNRDNLDQTRMDYLVEAYHNSLATGLSNNVKKQLLSKDFMARYPVNEGCYVRDLEAAELRPTHPLNWMMSIDRDFWLPDAQLVKIDRMSMAHAVEARSPFLDQSVVDVSDRIPVNFKLRGSVEKFILKQIATKYLPSEIVHRKKQELAVPLESWICRGFGQTIKESILDDRGILESIFDRKRLERFVLSDDPSNSYALWTIFMLNKWFENSRSCSYR